MKHKILKFSTVILLFAFTGASCHKDEIEYADENIVFTVGGCYPCPGLCVYKTKGDYFNYISFQLLDDGRLNAKPAYTLKDVGSPVEGNLPIGPRLKRDKKGKIVSNSRWRLKGGYILDLEASLKHGVFTDITFQEFVDYTEKHNTGSWPDELLKPRIIDKEPFKEFYYLSRNGLPAIDLTVGEINKMIEEGTLETVFKKLK